VDDLETLVLVQPAYEGLWKSSEERHRASRRMLVP
jgi:hypothetical protein